MFTQAGSATEEYASWFVGEERRGAERHRSTKRAIYHPLGTDDPPRQACVQDVSTLGVGLVLPQPVGPSTLLHLDFEGATGGLIRAALARVVHAATDAGRLVGCAFVRELDDALLRLFQAQRLGTVAGDSRRWIRFPCNVETVCYSLDASPGEQRPARILNISAGGMGLLLPCEFGAGTLLKLDLGAAAGSAARPALLRVVRAMNRSGGDWFLGCEFTDQLSGEELKALL